MATEGTEMNQMEHKCELCGEVFLTDSTPGWMVHQCPKCLPRNAVFQCGVCGDIVSMVRKRKYCSDPCAREGGRRKAGFAPRTQCTQCGEFHNSSHAHSKIKEPK